MSLELSNIAVFTSPNKFNIGYGTATFNEGLQVRFSIRKSNAGQEFVAWPQSSYDKDGTKVYVNEVTLLKEVSNEINDQIITEFNKLLAVGGTDNSKKKDGGPNIPSADSSAPASSGGPASTKKTKPKVKNNW